MKTIKRLGCILLAVLLLLGLSTTAFASSGYPDDHAAGAEGAGNKDDGNGKESFPLTIQETMAGHKFTAYQIFSGTLYVDDKGVETLSDIQWGSGITDAGKNALISHYLGDGYSTENASAADVAAKINGTVADAVALAKILNEEGNLTSGIVLDGNGGETGYYKNNMAPGYYLILDEDISGNASTDFVLSDYIVQIVGTTTMKPKADVPKVEKKVIDDENKPVDATDYDIGDKVPFTLTATLPSNYTAYETYKLVFHDTLSPGLTFNNDVTVTDGEGNPIDATKYTVKTDELSDGCSFEVVFENTKGIDGLSNGSKIVVSYSAELNKNAVIGGDGNANSVKLEYSNDPKDDSEGTPPTGHTPEDKVVVFTFQVTVNKKDEKNDPLSGAAFTLSKKNGEAWDEVKAFDAGEIVKFDFTGIDSGIYKLEETTTPAGYNSIEDIYFKIEATFEGESCKSLTITACDENGESLGEEDTGLTFTVELDKGIGSTDVLNQSGLQLPETGGVGTTLFYVLGGVLVAVALVLLVTKRRMKNEQ